MAQAVGVQVPPPAPRNRVAIPRRPPQTRTEPESKLTMQVSEALNEGLKRELKITIPASDLGERLDSRLEDLKGRANIPGFRPGKVPVSIIKKRYGTAVLQEVAGELMQRNYIEAIVSEKINPAGAPSFAPKTLETGKDLEFEATFEVYPEVELQGLDKIAV